jgi:hypothetical protein
VIPQDFEFVSDNDSFLITTISADDVVKRTENFELSIAQRVTQRYFCLPMDFPHSIRFLLQSYYGGMKIEHNNNNNNNNNNNIKRSKKVTKCWLITIRCVSCNYIRGVICSIFR